MTEGPCFAVAVSLGPVEGFIAAGRRSRDLWYGSRLLWWRVVQVASRLDRRFRDSELADSTHTVERIVPSLERLEQHLE